MLNFGNKDLDEFISCDKPEIMSIYGPASSGKTTLCLMVTSALASRGKKIVFIDTEGGFNVERLNQIAGWNYLTILDKILLLKVKSFEEQCEKIELLKNLENIDLVIIDTLSFFYRKALKSDSVGVNQEMNKQLNVLSNLVRKGVQVIMSHQVYDDINSGSLKLVGGDMVKNWSKRLLKLEKEPNRKLILEKPKEQEINVSIVDRGFVKI